MNNSSLKTTIIGIIVALGLLLIAVFKMGLGGPATPINTPSVSQNAAPQVVSTTPQKLMNKETLTIIPTQVIEITLNKPLENVPETKISIEPKADVDITLANDNKTIRVTPKTPYSLGQGYGLVIKAQSKIQGGETLGHDENFSFQTVGYNGV